MQKGSEAKSPYPIYCIPLLVDPGGKAGSYHGSEGFIAKPMQNDRHQYE